MAMAIGLGSTARADDPPPEAPSESAWEALTRMPPRTAWDAGLHVSLGNIGYWRDETPPWVGFGLRGGWGRVFGDHRLGAAGTLSVEGPIPLYWSAILEPQATWDVVLKGLALGASVGPALMLHSELETTGMKGVFGVAPSAAFRVGYSEPWSRVGRRFFVHAEPKLRWIRDGLDWSVALVIGSGAGR